MNISISGDALGRLANISSDLSGAMAQAAELVEASAKGACPVDTGALQASITSSSSSSSASVSAGAAYAAFVEFGTCKMAAQPYLVPALLNNTDAIIGVIKGAVLGG